MTAFEPITRIFSGWADILAGKPTWRDKFDPDGRGLVLASIAYLLAFVVVMAVRAALIGRLPGPLEALASLVLACLLVVAMLIAIVVTKLILRFKAPIPDLLVPAIYAVAALILLQLALGLISAQLAQVLYGALAYMMFKAGRTIAGLGIASAIAFAVLCIVLLVGMPLGLYMLLAPGPGPI